MSPGEGQLTLFDGRLVLIDSFPLDRLTATVMLVGASTMLYVEVDGPDTDQYAAPMQVIVLMPESRAAADEWAVMLARCGLVVYGHVGAAALAGLRGPGRCRRPRGVQANQPRNALNGGRPLVYWVR